MSQMMCHKLIKEAAVEIAGEQYDEFARNNAWYRINPNQKAWIAKHWALYVPLVREMFAKMLAGDYPEEMKAPIAEALLLDRSLPGSFAPRAEAVH